MAVFDAIYNALNGKPQKPAAQPNSGGGQAQGDFDADKEILIRNRLAAGLDRYGNPLPKQAKSLPSMQDHADQMHPVKR